MKIKHLALALTALALAAAPRAARADEVSFQYFYDTLSPLGEWVQIGDYGDCWHPNGVDADWSPYTDGYWSYTDAGWTWVSYEDFGGITYHYGRWVRTDEVGWCWVPDYDWGPAWVSWRNSDTAIGWAPLPPEAHWRASIGFSTWCDDSYDIGPGYYNFCPVVDFGAPLIRVVCYPRARNVFFLGNTVNITNITYNSYSNVIFNGGPNFTFISEHVHRPIPSFKLVTNFNVNRGVAGWTNARTVGNTLQVYAPKIVNNNTTVINRPKITKVINKTQVTHGWNLVQNPAEKEKLHALIKEQNHGLTAESSPARPVKPEELKHVPEKADLKAQLPGGIANGGRGQDRNHDGIPDNQENKGGFGKNPGVTGVDRNGDGIPDNKEKFGKGPKVGQDTPENMPEHPNKGQGGFQPPGGKKPKGEPENGGLVPGGREGNGVVEEHGKRGNDAQVQQEEAARRQAEIAERQEHMKEQQQQRIQEQQQIQEGKKEKKEKEREQQGQQVERGEKQQHQAEAQQQAIEAQRRQQQERQEELQRQRQQEMQRQRQPQPQPNAGGGGKGGKKQLTPEEIEALKKQQRGGN